MVEIVVLAFFAAIGVLLVKTTSAKKKEPEYPNSYSSPWAIPGEADLSGNEKAIASNSKESSVCDSATESVPEACNHDWIFTGSGECTIGYCSYGGCDPTHSYTEYHCRYCGDMHRDCGGCPHDGFCNGD